MTYLDEHIKDIVVTGAKEVKLEFKKYLCIADYMMDSGELAYKKGLVYITDGVLDNNNYFTLPSIFDKKHKMNTLDDFYEYFLDVVEQEDSIVNNVVESFKSRSEAGLKKYGTNLDRKDLSFLEWINHLQMELQDAILYAEKLKKEYNEQKNSNDKPDAENKNSDELPIHEGIEQGERK